MKLSPLFLVFVAISAAACSEEEVPKGGAFVYDCGVSWDPACAGSSGQAAFPTRVAVGSTFAIRYSADSGRFSTLRFEPEGIVTGDAAYLRAKKAGKVAIVAHDFFTDEEIDRVTIESAEPEKIRILDPHTREEPKSDLDVGDEIDVVPQLEADATLAGASDTDFVVEPNGALVRDPSKRGWSFRAKKPGKVTLRARSGEATGSIDFVVRGR